jgi:hypothetical protein
MPAHPRHTTLPRLRQKRRRDLLVPELEDLAVLSHRDLPFCLELNTPLHLRVASPLPDAFSLWYEGRVDPPGKTIDPRETLGTPEEVERKRLDGLVPRAPLKKPRSDAQLAGPSEAPTFQQSDGSTLGTDGTSVVHCHFQWTRVGVVSSDHVHVNHVHKVRRWTIRVQQAKSWKGAYIGVTQASAFQHAGSCLARDMYGNEMRGSKPVVASGFYPTSIETNSGLTSDSVVRVTANLATSSFTWEVFPRLTIEEGDVPTHAMTQPLPGWRAARGCV